MAVTRRARIILLLGLLLLSLATVSLVYRSRISAPATKIRHSLTPKHDSTTGKGGQLLLTNEDAAPRKVWTGDGDNVVLSSGDQTSQDPEDEEDEDVDESEQTADTVDDKPEKNVTTVIDRGDYRELFSLSTRDRKYIPIHMDGKKNWNPNLLPHPTRADEWVVVAAAPGVGNVGSEMTCAVGMLDGVLVCSSEPQDIPVAKSIFGKCEGKAAYFNARTGPRDARVFYGPDAPYIIYGSQSTYTCLGLWLQDARTLLHPFHLEESTGNKLFKSAKEIRRPAPWGVIEKNFFLFWDENGKTYAHYDIWPKRVFAALDFDGSVGDNLAVKAERSDKFCMAQHMPVVLHDKQTIHQATNSLWITLCKRSDPHCKPNNDNTFIMHIFQFKTDYWKRGYYDYTIYEPYVVLFKRKAPFAIHAIGQKPLWIHGRQTEITQPKRRDVQKRELQKRLRGHEMLYVTSISWKKHGQRHHGYIDDVIFIGFGIDDQRSAVIDVKAEDLVVDLAFC